MQKIILVTGSSSGIGEYIAKQYLENKNNTVIGLDISNSAEQLSNYANYSFHKVDLKNEDEVKKVFNKIPKIDIAINCAGVSSIRKPLIEFTQDEIINAWSDNFIPCFNAVKHEIEIMKKAQKGKIINIASITGHIGMQNFLGYSTAKAGIINMTKVIAKEQAKDNIRVNSISPATIDTPMIRKKYNGALRDYSDVFYTKHCGTVNDVYTIVKMLEENEFLTGTDIKLDGGLTDLFSI